jgi:hypothetical protein
VEQLEYERSGKVPMRQASVILTKPPTHNPIEMELDLDAGCVLSYKKVTAGHHHPDTWNMYSHSRHLRGFNAVWYCPARASCIVHAAA